jgi:hypothetical protein
VARRSIADQYDALVGRRDELLAVSAPSTVSPIHVQTVKVLGDLLTLGQQFSSGKVPPALRAMMRMLHKMEPELVNELSVVPPAMIKEFLADLMARMATIVDLPDDPTATVTALSDQS